MRAIWTVGLWLLAACGPTTDNEKPTDTDVEPTDVEPTETDVDPTDTDDDPTETDADPTDTDVEPTETDVDPTETDVDPTDTDDDPTETDVEPTETDVEPTETDVEPTETDDDPTETDVEPTETDVDPSETDVEPTDIPVTDPTDTAAPTDDSGTPDADGDGFPAGRDCDDLDPDRNPGAGEPIGDGIDQDCDGLERCFIDLDGDGIGRDDAEFTEDLSCTTRGFSTRTGDCRDSDPTQGPQFADAPADGVDGDCDGRELCYVDSDHDGFGGPLSEPQLDFTCTSGELTTISGDCSDEDGGAFPGSYEVPGNLVDEDCDGLDLCWQDLDGDGNGDAEILDFPGCPNSSLSSGDCDDLDPNVNPRATELPGDFLDSDCDGWELCWNDDDQDGYAPDDAEFLLLAPDVSCSAPAYTAVRGDCDAHDLSIYPGAPEIPADGVDQDCDGLDACPIDGDGDGFAGTGIGVGPLGCPDLTYGSDCDDTNGTVHPGQPEAVNDVDDDCNPNTLDPGVALFFADDGSVTDVAATWRRGSTPIVSGPGTVWLGTGTHTGRLILDGDITVRGGGPGLTTWSADGMLVAYLADGGLTLQDLTLTGTETALVFEQRPLTLNNIEITGFTTTALDVRNTTLTATDVWAHDNHTDHRLIWLSWTDATFTGLRAEDNTAGDGAAVLDVDHATITWLDSEIRDNVSANGAITATDSQLTANQTTFAGNTGSSGAAFFLSNTDLRLDGATLEHNHAELGGAIYAGLSGEVIFSNTVAHDNSADTEGGVIFADDAQVSFLDGSRLHDNHAWRGGVLCGPDVATIVGEARFEDNIADTYGGAIFLAGGSLDTGAGSTFVGNYAPVGGAVATSSTPITMLQSTFLSNTAGTRGAALFVNAADNGCAASLSTCPNVTLTGVTATGNISPAGVIEADVLRGGLLITATQLIASGNQVGGTGALRLFADVTSAAHLDLERCRLAGNTTAAGDDAAAVYIGPPATLESRFSDFGTAMLDLFYGATGYAVDDADAICENGGCIVF